MRRSAGEYPADWHEKGCILLTWTKLARAGMGNRPDAAERVSRKIMSPSSPDGPVRPYRHLRISLVVAAVAVLAGACSEQQKRAAAPPPPSVTVALPVKRSRE